MDASRGQTDFDVLAFERRADAANHFASPQLIAEENQRAVFESTDSAEKIIVERSVVSIHTAAGQLSFESCVAFGYQCSGTGAERLVLETVDQRFQGGEFGCRDYDGMAVGFAIFDFVLVAIVAQTVKMAEEIESPSLIGGSCAQNAAPNSRGIGASNRLAILVGFREFKSSGANIRA